MPNGNTTAELTRRIQHITPRRTNTPKRGKFWEWAEAAEELLSILNDYSPALTAVVTFALLLSIAASK